jgi:hypothetical protein
MPSRAVPGLRPAPRSFKVLAAFKFERGHFASVGIAIMPRSADRAMPAARLFPLGVMVVAEN